MSPEQDKQNNQVSQKNDAVDLNATNGVAPVSVKEKLDLILQESDPLKKIELLIDLYNNNPSLETAAGDYRIEQKDFDDFSNAVRSVFLSTPLIPGSELCEKACELTDLVCRSGEDDWMEEELLSASFAGAIKGLQAEGYSREYAITLTDCTCHYLENGFFYAPHESLKGSDYSLTSILTLIDDLDLRENIYRSICYMTIGAELRFEDDGVKVKNFLFRSAGINLLNASGECSYFYIPQEHLGEFLGEYTTECLSSDAFTQDLYDCFTHAWVYPFMDNDKKTDGCSVAEMTKQLCEAGIPRKTLEKIASRLERDGKTDFRLSDYPYEDCAYAISSGIESYTREHN